MEFYGIDEVDCNFGSVANASDIPVPQGSN